MRALICLMLVLPMFGCTPPASGGESANESDVTVKPKQEWPTDVVVYKNEKGEVMCPIMKTAIAKPEMAVGHQDYKGKRYYFCCDGCPEKFKADPAQYAK